MSTFKVGETAILLLDPDSTSDSLFDVYIAELAEAAAGDQQGA